MLCLKELKNAFPLLGLSSSCELGRSVGWLWVEFESVVGEGSLGFGNGGCVVGARDAEPGICRVFGLGAGWGAMVGMKGAGKKER